jgi:pilus assembly protein CpaD
MISSYLTIATRHGAWAIRLIATAGCAIALAGCLGPREITDNAPDRHYQRHPIVISERPRTVDLLIGDKRDSLTGAQRAEVLSFAREWRREATAGILIDAPHGNVAAGHAVREIRSILAASGVPSEAVGVREYRQPRGKLAALRLRYPRVMADAGPCGLWPDDIGPTYSQRQYENKEYWNFGCAQQRNLAAMVENPADLVQPRGETPAYTGRRAVVLDKYRQGESTSTIYPNAEKGKISDVGK